MESTRSSKSRRNVRAAECSVATVDPNACTAATELAAIATSCMPTTLEGTDFLTVTTTTSTASSIPTVKTASFNPPYDTAYYNSKPASQIFIVLYRHVYMYVMLCADVLA